MPSQVRTTLSLRATYKSGAPTAGLDPQSRRGLWRRIEELRGEGSSILLTTHSMEEAQAVCDRVAIIDHGVLLTVGRPSELIDKHRDDRELGVLQRLRVSPAPTWMVMASRLIVQVIANLVASIIVVIVGAIVHGLTLNAAQYLLVIVVAVLGAAVFLSIGQAVVGLVKSTSAVNAISRLLMGLLIVLGLTGGTGLLGDTMKTIADWSPVGALMALFSDVLNQSAWSAQDTYSLLACLGYIIVFASIGIRWFRWNTR